jgi:hypothetical protein
METTTDMTTAPSDQRQAWDAAAAETAALDADRKTRAKTPRSFTEKMPVALSEKDIVGIAGLIEQADAEACALEDERKATNDTFKAKISLAEQRRTDLISKVRSKTEMRDVELLEEFLFATNTVRVLRADTKEVVRSRAMTQNERQEELPLDADQDEPEPVEVHPDDPPPVLDNEITDPQGALDGEPPGDAAKPKRKPRTGRRSAS